MLPIVEAPQTPVPITVNPVLERVAIGLPSGDAAAGWVAYPDAVSPSTLVVFCHAFALPASHFLPWMQSLARNGTAAIAMDYRGALGSFNVDSGVEDTVAATEFMQASFPSIQTTIIYGFSMGGEVAGVTVALMPAGTFDYWITGAGVSDLGRFWEENEFFRAALEAETGGTPTMVPAQYARRSPQALTERIAENLGGVVLIHARADPVVSFAQSKRVYEELKAHGDPVVLIEVAGSRTPWACSRLDAVCRANPWATLESHAAGDVSFMGELLERMADGRWVPPTTSTEIRIDGEAGLAGLFS